MRWLPSIESRLLALTLGLVASLWCAAAALTWFDARHELDELLDAHLAQAAALLVAQQLPEAEDDAPGIDAPMLHRYAPRVAFQVFHEGQPVLQSRNAPAAPMVEAARGDGFHSVTLADAEWRVFVTRGAERDVRVLVGERIGSRAAILRAVLRGALWPLAIALPLLWLALWLSVRGGLAPLRQLGRLLAQRSAGDVQPVVLPAAPTEVGPVVDSLNALFARIGVLLASERRFTADAAHELRTPIAAIRAQAQVALGEQDDAGRRAALQATLAGCDRASRVVEQLLTLARLEASPALSPVQVDLADLARQAVADAAPAAIAKGQSIALEAEAPVRVQGDATLLAILLRNLVDNAVRYSPNGARIDIAALEQAGAATLLVEDGGVGLAEADRARLGERFFRVPGNTAPGSGLGLSISQRIAQAHGAALAFTRSERLGGLAVRVAFPRAAATAPSSPRPPE